MSRSSSGCLGTDGGFVGHWVLSLHGRYAILGGPRQRRPGHSHRREIYAHRSSIQLICRHCRFPLIETFLWIVIVAGMFAIDRGSDREREEMRW